MDKRHAIQIMTKAAQLYRDNLDSFAKDGSTGQKLDILENMMLLKKNATMIGEFTDKGPKLFAEKAAGNVCGCIGFVKDKNTIVLTCTDGFKANSKYGFTLFGMYEPID